MTKPITDYISINLNEDLTVTFSFNGKEKCVASIDKAVEALHKSPRFVKTFFMFDSNCSIVNNIIPSFHSIRNEELIRQTLVDILFA